MRARDTCTKIGMRPQPLMPFEIARQTPVFRYFVCLDKIMFTGTYTAIVTPFRGGQLDEAALERLIKFQIKGGVDGIVPVGTTGESPTVNYEEHIKIVALSVKFAARKIKVLAGTGGNATSEAVYLTQEAEKAGADGSLQVAPYYNKPTQEGLYQHFKAVAKVHAATGEAVNQLHAVL